MHMLINTYSAYITPIFTFPFIQGKVLAPVTWTGASAILSIRTHLIHVGLFRLDKTARHSNKHNVVYDFI